MMQEGTLVATLTHQIKQPNLMTGVAMSVVKVVILPGNVL